MSFNTIIEAEKTADLVVNAAKNQAKQLVAEAQTKQITDLEVAKSQAESKLETDFVDFEAKIKAEVEDQQQKSEKAEKALMQTLETKKDSVVKQIVESFK